MTPHLLEESSCSEDISVRSVDGSPDSGSDQHGTSESESSSSVSVNEGLFSSPQFRRQPVGSGYMVMRVINGKTFTYQGGVDIALRNKEYARRRRLQQGKLREFPGPAPWRPPSRAPNSSYSLYMHNGMRVEEWGPREGEPHRRRRIHVERVSKDSPSSEVSSEEAPAQDPKPSPRALRQRRRRQEAKAYKQAQRKLAEESSDSSHACAYVLPRPSLPNTSVGLGVMSLEPQREVPMASPELELRDAVHQLDATYASPQSDASVVLFQQDDRIVSLNVDASDAAVEHDSGDASFHSEASDEGPRQDAIHASSQSDTSSQSDATFVVAEHDAVDVSFHSEASEEGPRQDASYASSQSDATMSQINFGVDSSDSSVNVDTDATAFVVETLPDQCSDFSSAEPELGVSPPAMVDLDSPEPCHMAAVRGQEALPAASVNEFKWAERDERCLACDSSIVTAPMTSESAALCAELGQHMQETARLLAHLDENMRQTAALLERADLILKTARPGRVEATEEVLATRGEPPLCS